MNLLTPETLHKALPHLAAAMSVISHDASMPRDLTLTYRVKFDGADKIVLDELHLGETPRKSPL